MSRSRHRQHLLIAAGLLGIALLGLMATATWLLTQSRSTAQPLPVLEALNDGAPHFVFSINGPKRPLGVALSPAGDKVYVTESDGEHETRIYDRQGALLGALNPPDSTSATRTPVYVAASPTTGAVYVSDRQSGGIDIYAASGEWTGFVRNPDDPNTAWAPLGLGFDDAGNLLVTDVAATGQRVLQLGPDGTLQQRFDTPLAASGGLAYPNGITADSQGRVLVADSNNGRVLVVDSTSGVLLTLGRGGFGPALGLPRGVAVDGSGRVYVADATNHHVMIYSLGDNPDSARLVASVGDEGIGDGEFEFPNGVAVDRSARLYVADRENDRVQVWTY
jgi:DNA-binding beta-propeller fold protein YncE